MRGCLWIKTAYIIQFLPQTSPGIWRIASFIAELDLFQGEELRDTKSRCTYLTLSTAVSTVFLDPLQILHAGPVCQNKFWLTVYFEKCKIAHWKCIIRFFCLYNYSEIHLICFYASNRGFAEQIFLYKTSNVMKKWEPWVFQCNVLQYSSFFLFQKRSVLLFFCLLCCAYFCLKGPAEQTNLLYFLHIPTLIYCLKTVSFIQAILKLVPPDNN